jgi:hypothetical protein
VKPPPAAGETLIVPVHPVLTFPAVAIRRLPLLGGRARSARLRARDALNSRHRLPIDVAVTPAANRPGSDVAVE